VDVAGSNGYGSTATVQKITVSMYCPGMIMVIPQLVTGVAAYEGCGYTMMESAP